MRMARGEGRRLRRALTRDERLFVFFAAEVFVDALLAPAAVDFVAEGLVEDAESELCAAESETVSNPAVAATRRLRKPWEKCRGRHFIETL
jgi:hypothetical protein